MGLRDTKVKRVTKDRLHVQLVRKDLGKLRRLARMRTEAGYANYTSHTEILGLGLTLALRALRNEMIEAGEDVTFLDQ